MVSSDNPKFINILVYDSFFLRTFSWFIIVTIITVTTQSFAAIEVEKSSNIYSYKRILKKNLIKQSCKPIFCKNKKFNYTRYLF